MFLLHAGCLVDVGVGVCVVFFVVEFVRILWITVDLRTEDLKGIMLWLRVGCMSIRLCCAAKKVYQLTKL